MRVNEFINEGWSQKYKKSINCSHPKGFSQRAHCAGKKKHNESIETEMTCPDCGLCEAHGNSKIYDKCWTGFRKVPGKKRGEDGSCKKIGEDEELHQEFDLIEQMVEHIARQHAIDPEFVWEDLESLTDDELYVFAVTQEPIMEYGDTKKGQKMLTKVQKRAVDRVTSKRADTDPAYAKKNSDTANRAWDRMTDKDLEEDWQKVNKRDKTDGMSKKAVNAYRRENPGSKLKTAVTTKPSKLKRGSKASKRRKSYCSRSAGQKSMHHIDCSKTPDKAICKARRRWNC